MLKLPNMAKKTTPHSALGPLFLEIRNVGLFFFLLGLLFLAACTPFQPRDPGATVEELPNHYSLYSTDEAPPTAWWKQFNDPDLTAIIDKAFTDNFSVQEAVARLKQAEVTARIAGVAMKPTLSYSGSSTYQEQKNAGHSSTSEHTWGLGLTAAYEFDLWGRLQANQEKNRLLADASAYDLHTLYMTISGAIAEDWIKRISLRLQETLIKEQLSLQEKLLEILLTRFPNGHATALDIYQQKQAVQQLQTALIPLESKLENLQRSLALLTGAASFATPPPIPKQFPDLPPFPSLGLPANLLAARPDVRAAGLRLQSAEWQVSAAEADRLPTLDLTAAYNLSASRLDALFDNWIMRLAATVTGPLFDGNRRKLEVEKVQAVVDERLAQYKKTVVTAYHEVENALTDEQQQKQTLQLLQQQLALSDKTMHEAQNRYLNGNSDVTNVLREGLNRLSLQQQQLTATEQLLIARIHIHKALGGSWPVSGDDGKDNSHAARQQ